MEHTYISPEIKCLELSFEHFLCVSAKSVSYTMEVEELDNIPEDVIAF